MVRSCTGARLVGTVGVTLVSAMGLTAQTVDQGVFQLSVNGEAVGSEEFVIQRTGTGAAQITLARGTLTLTGSTIITQLQVTGPDLSVFRYSVQVTGEDARSVNVARTGNRLQARTVAPWGEELREYRATAGTLLLDRGVAHHYFLLRPFLEQMPGSAHVVSPLAELEETLSGFELDAGTRSVAGEPTEVRILRTRGRDGLREAWFDSSGRLVRVSDEGSGFVAERTPST
ncbi:MAG: hypothetical protein HKN73_11285 [Gemmatimonadetes bacterium]|nr:hypothetical protein [Gemmatimonadota bacterium]